MLSDSDRTGEGAGVGLGACAAAAMGSDKTTARIANEIMRLSFMVPIRFRYFELTTVVAMVRAPVRRPVELRQRLSLLRCSGCSRLHLWLLPDWQFVLVLPSLGYSA